ncbi:MULTISPECIES: acyltransferase [unclassified Sphingomonas]|uniref:acyltransferase n=1 Tax=unclassified Sphingomonas TaxID=196159 RepID=UPI00285D4068|nr:MULTISPECIES: acyltransferase [unclassified Sphingomonas]MDR6115792.1 putative membrane protein YcfT [Sphingomonas sp. SORGH_AS_0789]MDR6150537.1 putative membrane protein YcfT [Sphingomonas sp. SORGH_AS_0742]
MQKPRLDWIDAGRGFCGVGVVLYHVCDWFSEFSPDRFLLQDVALALAPLRMPLFFLISGILSQNIHKAPVEKRDARIVGLLFIYLFWSCILFSRSFLITLATGETAPTVGEFLTALAIPTIYWFLLCLPLFNVLIILCKNRIGPHPWPVLLVALAMALLSNVAQQRVEPMVTNTFGHVQVGPILFNFIWFALGAYFGEIYKRIVQQANGMRLLVTGLLCALVIWASWGSDAAGVRLIKSVLLLWFFANLLGMIPGRLAIMRIFKSVGKQTLPLYIFHILIIAGVGGLIRIMAPPLDAIHQSSIVANGVILGVTVFLTVICVVAGQWLSNSRFSWLIVPRYWGRAPRAERREAV